jgi:hypothetical protein
MDLISSAFIGSFPSITARIDPSESLCKSLDNKDGIDAQHPEGVIQDVVDLIHPSGFVDYKVLKGALRV